MPKLSILLSNQANQQQKNRLLEEKIYAIKVQEWITRKQNNSMQPQTPPSLKQSLWADQVKAGKPPSGLGLNTLLGNSTFLAQVNTNWKGKIISAGLVVEKSTGKILQTAPILRAFQKAGLNYNQLCYLIRRRGGCVINLETRQVEE